jgi:shikimate kinase
MASVNPPENIVLTGFMGTGKSSIGRLIATRLGFQFVDTDQLIVEKGGRPIPQIFQENGEDYFREEETAAAQSLLGRNQLVIATGGGIVTLERNIPLLNALGVIFWLTASEEVIFERVSRNSKRPLLQTEDPRKTISELLAARLPHYSAASHFTVDTSLMTHQEAADTIISQAKKHFSWQT